MRSDLQMLPAECYNSSYARARDIKRVFCAYVYDSRTLMARVLTVCRLHVYIDDLSFLPTLKLAPSSSFYIDSFSFFLVVLISQVEHDASRKGPGSDIGPNTYGTGLAACNMYVLTFAYSKSHLVCMKESVPRDMLHCISYIPYCKDKVQSPYKRNTCRVTPRYPFCPS